MQLPWHSDIHAGMLNEVGWVPDNQWHQPQHGFGWASQWGCLGHSRLPCEGLEEVGEESKVNIPSKPKQMSEGCSRWLVIMIKPIFIIFGNHKASKTAFKKVMSSINALMHMEHQNYTLSLIEVFPPFIIRIGNWTKAKKFVSRYKPLPEIKSRSLAKWASALPTEL